MCNHSLCPFRQTNRSMKRYLHQLRFRYYKHTTIFERYTIFNCIILHYNAKFVHLFMNATESYHCPREFEFAFDNDKHDIATIILENHLIEELCIGEIKRKINYHKKRYMS